MPIFIHRHFPNFFPSRDTSFDLKVPTGDVFQAKLCQDDSKALMTNPNKAMSDWLLRDIFQLQEGELLTKERLNLFGFDSVIIYKDSLTNYRIDVAKFSSYQEFINQFK